MTEPDNFLKLKSIKSEIFAIAKSAGKYGSTTNSLINEYSALNSESFPYHDFGFKSPYDFLKSCHFEDTCYLKNGKWYSVKKETTQHLEKLINGQRANGMTSLKPTITLKYDQCNKENVYNGSFRPRSQSNPTNYMYFQKSNNKKIFKNHNEDEVAEWDKNIKSAKEKLDQTEYFTKIETIIYQIMKSEKGLVAQDTLHERFEPFLNNFFEQRHNQLTRKFSRPKDFLQNYGRNVLKEIRFFLGQDGNVRAEIRNNEVFDKNLEEKDVINRWTLKNVTIRPLPTPFTIRDVPVSTQLKIENKIINILKSEAKCHWITHTTLQERFQAAIGDPNFLINCKSGTDNYVPFTQKKFFEYYGKNIIKEVKFFEDETGDLVEMTDGVIDINKVGELPKKKIFERWVLLEDLAYYI